MAVPDTPASTPQPAAAASGSAKVTAGTAPYVTRPTRWTLFTRTFIPWQLWRFARINLKMIRIIRSTRRTTVGWNVGDSSGEGGGSGDRGTNVRPGPESPVPSGMATSPLVERIRRGIIGEGELMDGPFGPRRVTYADYTASGRSLDFLEDFIREQVLPRYANTHTESFGHRPGHHPAARGCPADHP